MVDENKKNIRNKDNVQSVLKPNFSTSPALNIAPSGAMGIRQDLGQPQKQSQRQTTPPPVSIVKNHPQPRLLTDGKFLNHPDHSFVLKVENYRSPVGIECGKVSQLEIQHQGKIIAQYIDREWTVKPSREDQKQMVQDLQDKFGERQKEFVPIIQHGSDKDRGFER